MKKILFVCSGNTCRSPMAEGLFNFYAKNNNLNVNSSSAGVFAHGDKASNNSIAAMRKFGIDISSHIPAQLTEKLINEADLILTMTQSHKDYLLNFFNISNGKVYTLSEYTGSLGDISDPFGNSLAVYENTAQEIRELILKLIKKVEFYEG